MNKVDSIELGDTGKDECNKCGMHIEDSNGCCKNDVKLMKLEVDQSVTTVLSTDFSLHLLLPLTTQLFTAALQNTIQEDYPLSHGPPLSKQDTYLKNCVFRL